MVLLFEVPSPTRAQAIDAIRKLASAPGGIQPSRPAQRGIDRLGHDIIYVSEVLAGLQADECVGEEDSDWSGDFGEFRVYIFHVELEDEVDLYVKVSLHIGTLDRAQLLSYKPLGSPE